MVRFKRAMPLINDMIEFDKIKKWIQAHPILAGLVTFAIVALLWNITQGFGSPDESFPTNNLATRGYTPYEVEYCTNISYEPLVCRSDSIGNYICDGLAHNHCDTPISHVKVIGSYYDKNGRFIGTSYTYTDISTIPAHSSSPFSLYTTENGIIFDKYTIQFEWY